MKTISIETLSTEAFMPFVFFVTMIHPVAEKFGVPPIEFFRDVVQQNLGDARSASLSVCRVAPRELVIEISESHSTLGETQLPLGGDILIHVGPATPDGKASVNVLMCSPSAATPMTAPSRCSPRGNGCA